MEYLLSIQTSTIGLYANVAFTRDVKAALLDLLNISRIRIGSDDFFYLCGVDLGAHISGELS